MAEAGTVRILAIGALAILLGAVLAGSLARRAAAGPGTPTLRPFLGHLEELRRRLLAVVATLLAGVVACLALRIEQVDGYPVPVPGLYDTIASQAFRAMAEHLLPQGVTLAVLSPMEGFQAQFTVAVGLAAAVAIPVALYHAARFVAPALRPHEMRAILAALAPATALFLVGAAFCYVLVLPATMDALYAFGSSLDATTFLRAEDLPGTVLAFVLCFGLAFETPLAMVVLARLGLVDRRAFLRAWRAAVVAIVVAAGVLTPDPTLVSQAMLAVPLLLLYLLGAALAYALARPRKVRAHPSGR